MKNVILSTFLLVIGSAFAQEYSTDYEIQYEVEYSLDSLNLDKKTNETLYLFASSDVGVFLNYNDANEEKIKAEIERQLKSGHVDLTGIQKSTNFNSKIFKDRHQNKIIKVSEIGRKIYAYEEENTPFLWNIEDETKEFLGYQVQKATTSFAGRDYEAWFTMEVPINDGPYVFQGLPGLIVELYDTENHYHFTLTSIEKLNEPMIWETEETLTISKSELNEIKDKVQKNKLRSGQIGEQPDGTVISVTIDGKELSDVEYRRLRRKIADSKNNPIELE